MPQQQSLRRHSPAVRSDFCHSPRRSPLRLRWWLPAASRHLFIGFYLDFIIEFIVEEKKKKTSGTTASNASSPYGCHPKSLGPRRGLVVSFFL